jgi:hypothetical protein
MTDANEKAISDLEAARATLVKARRNWASAMAAGYVKDETENALVKFVEIQAAIEAIDRAIEDEEIEDDEEEDEDEDDQ